MKDKYFLITLITACLFIIIILIIYYASNIIPQKKNFKFNYINSQEFINNYEVQDNNGRIAIYLNINSKVFKNYDYHSYISGDGTGPKIFLEMYLVSEDKELCYKIKSNCYDYQNLDDIKILGYYYEMFINKQKKYNLAIYIPVNDLLYITDIDI